MMKITFVVLGPLSLLTIAAAGIFIAPDAAGVTEALRPGDTVSTCVVPDPVGGHSYKPNCKETIIRAGQKSEMAYNAEGLRDKDYPSTPKKGWKRVLMVGSSRQVGPGLLESDAPPRRLESYLRGANKKLEVINASVEGYFSINQVAKLQRWIDAYHPTHVVVQLEFGSSMNSDVMNVPYRVVTGDAVAINPRVLPWMKPFASLTGGSTPDNYAKYRKVLTWQSGIHRALYLNYCRIFYRSSLSKTACALEPTLRALVAMRNMVAKSGAKIIFVTSGGTSVADLTVSPAIDLGVAKFLDSVTAKVSIDTADVVQLIRKRKLTFAILPPFHGAQNFLPGDYHFNKEGADLFGRSLALRLQEFIE